MKPGLWNAIIVGTTAFFLALFFHSTDYFISHHLISVSFVVLSLFWMIISYGAYRAGRITRVQLCGILLLAVAFVVVGMWIDGVANRVMMHSGRL